MGKVIDGWTTNIHPNIRRIDSLELHYFAFQSIINHYSLMHQKSLVDELTLPHVILFGT
ncbi:hypothetical protein [Candidatus Liberibacter africanus]|uniref:hypothetical protein n=1 Tax=Liberibacter africanus TaxID=34020 RepID=UPI001FD1E217|nr:hypothetical protein [Candidatus Liberibacter africanus]